MRRPLIAGLLVLLTVSLTACGSGGAVTATAPKTAWHGVEPSPVPSRPSFVLTDTSGATFNFQAKTGGRPTLMYFGYTHCPDECPTAMADIASALRQTAADVRDDVRVIFVTTDPKRDSAPVLRRWLDQFSTEFIGLRGTDEQIKQAQLAVGIQPAYPDGVSPTAPGRPDEHVHKPGTAPHEHFGALGYAVAHSAVIFAYGADDRLPVVYPGGVTPADIAADLPALADPSA